MCIPLVLGISSRIRFKYCLDLQCLFIIILFMMFPAIPALEAQSTEQTWEGVNILSDHMPLAWRYQRISEERPGEVVADTVDIVFLKQLEPRLFGGIQSIGWIQHQLPDSIESTSREIAPWLIVEVSGYSYLWFETEFGLLDDLHSPRFGTIDRGYNFPRIILPSSHLGFEHWGTSPDASESITDTSSCIFRGVEYQTIVTSWSHFNPPERRKRIWAPGLGLFSEEHSYLGNCPRTSIQLIDIIPRNEPGRIHSLNLQQLSITDEELPDYLIFSNVSQLGLAESTISDASLSLLRHFHELRDVDLSRTNINGQGFTGATDWPTIRRIDLAGSKITGRYVKKLPFLDSIEILNLRNTRISNDVLIYLSERNSLRQLMVGNTVSRLALDPYSRTTSLYSSPQVILTAISDAGLQGMRSMPNLRLLDLSYTAISDQGLEHLLKHQQLRVLDLTGTQVSGNGVCMLAGHPQLEELVLANTDISVPGYQALHSMGNLRKLDLSQSTVSDSCITALVGSARLEELILFNTGISDACMEALATLPHLKHLDLLRTGITAASLPILSQMKTLRYLRLPNRAIQWEGLKALREALPETQIDPFFGVIFRVADDPPE